jgi:hypothetical protein
MTASQAVFLSYASQDVDAASKLCTALRAAGIDVWFDHSELRGGDVWDQKIRKQIRECHLFIPIISATTRSRTEGYFRLEWKLAVDRSHLISADRAFLLPVVIDDTTESDARVPDVFRDVQWTRLRGGDPDPVFLARIVQLLQSDDPATRAVSRPVLRRPAAASVCCGGISAAAYSVRPSPAPRRPYPTRPRQVRRSPRRLPRPSCRRRIRSRCCRS